MISFKTKEISILPDRTLMPKIGQTGYTISQAIAELVDNSIDARKDELLNVQITVDLEHNKIIVEDDGKGMTEEKAAQCLRLASSDKTNQLGEFGLGLKSACSSLGKDWIVKTIPEKGNSQYILEYNEEEFIKKGDWNKHEMRVGQGDKFTNLSGTVIEISNLRIKLNPNLAGNIRKDLAIRFAPFIDNKEVAIKVNSKLCIPEPLNLDTNYHRPDGKEWFEIKLESGKTVKGWRGLLKEGSNRGNNGFSVFRRGRLILQYAKLGFKLHPETRLIVGEIALDHIPVTHNKREFDTENSFWEEINKEDGIFNNFMKPIINAAKSSVRKTQIKQGIVDKVENQIENIMKAIKNSPELDELSFPVPEKKQRSDDPNNNDGKTLLPVEKRKQKEKIIIEIETVNTKKQKGRKPKKVHLRKRFFVYIKGKKFKIEHKFVDLKNETTLKAIDLNEAEGVLTIYTNTGFAAFANTTDHIFYAVWHVAEGIAEAMVKENRRPYEEVIKTRDLILKRASEISCEIEKITVDEKNQQEQPEKI
jgi:hypothetical protein